MIADMISSIRSVENLEKKAMHCGDNSLFIAVLICVGAALVSLSRARGSADWIDRRQHDGFLYLGNETTKKNGAASRVLRRERVSVDYHYGVDNEVIRSMRRKMLTHEQTCAHAARYETAKVERRLERVQRENWRCCRVDLCHEIRH